MWMVVSHYIGNTKLFDRMLITVLFNWNGAMKHVLGFTNSPYFSFLKLIIDKILNTCVHMMIVAIDQHRILHNAPGKSFHVMIEIPFLVLGVYLYVDTINVLVSTASAIALDHSPRVKSVILWIAIVTAWHHL